MKGSVLHDVGERDAKWSIQSPVDGHAINQVYDSDDSTMCNHKHVNDNIDNWCVAIEGFSPFFENGCPFDTYGMRLGLTGHADVIDMFLRALLPSVEVKENILRHTEKRRYRARGSVRRSWCIRHHTLKGVIFIKDHSIFIIFIIHFHSL